MNFFRLFTVVIIILIFSLILIHYTLAYTTGDGNIPNISISTWSSPSLPEAKRQDLSEVYALLGKADVKKILFTIRKEPLSAQEIAEKINLELDSTEIKLNELEAVDLVAEQDNRWFFEFPIFDKDDIRRAEKTALKYAKKEARLLKQEIPVLKKLYSRTQLSRRFDWNDVSLILVGAFLADFCVIDRIPYMSSNMVYTKELEPWLDEKGKGWYGAGFAVTESMFPTPKWHFYQNTFSRYTGGIARFGYFRSIEENRMRPPGWPEVFAVRPKGRILFSLAEAPMDFEHLEEKTRLEKINLRKKLNELMNYDPPAVTQESKKYMNNIPILSESDFNLLLPEFDRVAERIFREIMFAHYQERKRNETRGIQWIFPTDYIRVYVRDKALQILIEEAMLTEVPPPPVKWYFGVWGWQGFLLMDEQVRNGVKVDSFINSPVSAGEKKWIKKHQDFKEKIIDGMKYNDISTPADAFLTQFSGYFHSDLHTLSIVEIFSAPFDSTVFKEEPTQRLLEYLKGLEIWRIHLPDDPPVDGDVVPVFTSRDDTHVYLYYNDGWRYLYRTNYVWLWREELEKEKRKIFP